MINNVADLVMDLRKENARLRGELSEKGKSRFERLKETHPKIYEYCIGGGEFVDGIWQPNREGLGLGYVMDYINNLYGKKMLRY